MKSVSWGDNAQAQLLKKLQDNKCMGFKLDVFGGWDYSKLGMWYHLEWDRREIVKKRAVKQQLGSL